VERAVVDLALKVVERVRSSVLKEALKSIASKVVEALKSRSFKERAMAIGRALAERIARVAESLGCKRTKEWARDPGFVMYLGVGWLNTSPVFTSPAYASLYAVAYSEPDLNVAQYVATHLPSTKVNLDGSDIVNQLIALFSYPSHAFGVNLSITRTVEINALKGVYTHLSNTILTTRKPLLISASTVEGLTDIAIKEYVNTMLALYADLRYSSMVLARSF
jgi:hypothetical protein